MADFVQNSQTKSAIRTLTSQIEDVTTFNSIVQSVITDNLFACVSYMTAGVTHDPVEKTKESYTVKIIYQDTEAKTVGSLSDKYSTIAGFNSGATAILANTALSTPHGCTATRRPGQPPAFSRGEVLLEFPGRPRHKNFEYSCPNLSISWLSPVRQSAKSQLSSLTTGPVEAMPGEIKQTRPENLQSDLDRKNLGKH